MKKAGYQMLFIFVFATALISNYKLVKAGTNGIRQEQAVQWAKDRANENWEINDGSGQTQCVELIWKYYEYLLGPGSVVYGNACDYLTDTYGACPYSSGWTRPDKNTVQPGDIVIWDKYTYFREDRTDWCGDVGHIGIVVSVDGNSMVTAETNAGGVRGACTLKYNREVSCISGIIRPDFKCTNHTWDEGRIIKEATCKRRGTKKYTCIVCGEIKEESFAGDHKYKVKSKEKATLKKDGKLKKKCSVCKKEKTEKILRPKTIKVKDSKLTYTGSRLKPDIVVRDRRGKSIKNKYYTVKYSNNRKAGIAKAFVSFKGNYKGKKTLTFKIYPGETEILTLVGTGNSFTVGWKRKSEASGYQIQYATDRKFKKNARTVKITNKKSTSKHIKGLKSNRKYYVRIRAYSNSLYSSWSSVKTVLTETKQETYENESYETIIKKYKDSQEDYTSPFGGYSSVYYDYIDLKTPHGMQNALLITTYQGAYNMYSIVYIRDGNGKVIEYLSHSGQLTKITNDKDKFLLYGYIGSGMGSYYIMDYSDSNNNYIESKRYDFEMGTRESIAKRVDTETKGYNEFEAGQNIIYGW